ncbi:TPA: YbaY family lipoprotein [Providencia stuartii]|nr:MULTISPECIES: YbaY family lipoprotein [Providencia]APG51794.1 hypothetical protein BGK56_12860 [Providencia stuartii]AVL41979.1 hypothetical protein CEP70_19385 [Providencia stuartii]MBG5905970.1 YbaY family lipoprotein [Providencia stuartii]MBG5913365.1 YbaY family lipoprotein [Providencia stuartii]MBG5916830.1 YbaY family lipoprotein [Providencia stuartii]
MKIMNYKQRLKTSIFSFILAFFLSGCVKKPHNLSNKENAISLQGNIYSKNIDIPNESIITLSFSPLQQNDNENTKNDNFQFKTKEAGRTIAFSVALPPDINIRKNNLGISARVEKNNELIMMTEQISPFPKNNTDKISLTVVANQ